MPRKSRLSRIRSEAGKSGAASRWGDRTERATACIRVYPADADKLRRLAKESGQMPADIIAALLAERRR